MTSRLALAFGIALTCAAAAAAQAPAGPPAPGPEHKKLDYFVGKWTTESELKPSPFGPGGKMTGRDSCEWFAGGFHLVCRAEGKGPMGEVKGLSLLGYSGEEKAYTYMGIDNMGMGSTARGTLAGGVWTWNGEDKMGGKVIKSRYVITQQSKDAYTFKWDMSQDGGKTWTPVMEGKETRAAP
jgi:hypothetical protein